MKILIFKGGMFFGVGKKFILIKIKLTALINL